MKQFRKSSTRIAWLLFILSMLANSANSIADAADSAKPNFVVILADDLGYGDLSSYGATDLQTPHIDSLVARGLKFDFAYANCPVCSPTRASLFTGRYPELVGVPGVIRTYPQDSWGYLSQDCRLLPQLLKPAGYHSALVGKWHLGLESPNRPTDRGFDFFHGFLGDMMDDYYNHRRHKINYMYRNEIEIDPEGHATDLFTRWSCDYLRERAEKSEPFFLAITYNAPHTPIQPPEDWLKKVRQRAPDMPERRAKLVALIEHLDDGVGQVIKTLEATGLNKNTIVIFTSDNGGQLDAGANNGSLRDGKQSMYEGGIRVPMCVVYPHKVEPNSASHQRVLTMDILPTLCELAGVDIPAKVDGASFARLLDDSQATMPQRDLFFHRREGGNRYGGLTINAVIRGEWKLLQNSPFVPQELYHLGHDPQEQVDLARKNPQKFNELAAALRLQVQRGGAVPWQRDPAAKTGD
jgi:arylsulfatase A-like enzyme